MPWGLGVWVFYAYPIQHSPWRVTLSRSLLSELQFPICKTRIYDHTPLHVTKEQWLRQIGSAFRTGARGERPLKCRTPPPPSLVYSWL